MVISKSSLVLATLALLSVEQVLSIAPPVKIVHLASQLCLTVRGGDVKDGAVIDLYTCTGTPLQNNQRWDMLWSKESDSAGGTLIPVSQISTRQSGKCLTVNDVSSAIDQWSCMGGSNQEWIIMLQNPTVWDSVKIQNKRNGKCLFIADAMAQNGAKVSQEKCGLNFEKGQAFKILFA